MKIQCRLPCNGVAGSALVTALVAAGITGLAIQMVSSMLNARIRQSSITRIINSRDALFLEIKRSLFQRQTLHNTVLELGATNPNAWLYRCVINDPGKNGGDRCRARTGGSARAGTGTTNEYETAFYAPWDYDPATGRPHGKPITGTNAAPARYGLDGKFCDPSIDPNASKCPWEVVSKFWAVCYDPRNDGDLDLRNDCMQAKFINILFTIRPNPLTNWKSEFVDLRTIQPIEGRLANCDKDEYGTVISSCWGHLIPVYQSDRCANVYQTADHPFPYNSDLPPNPNGLRTMNVEWNAYIQSPFVRVHQYSPEVPGFQECTSPYPPGINYQSSSGPFAEPAELPVCKPGQIPVTQPDNSLACEAVPI